MSTEPATSLAGMGVLITRPAGQAGPLRTLLEQHGARPVLCPTLDIFPLVPPPEALALLRPVTADLLIFVSANAVQQAAPYLNPADLPEQTRIAAVGKATRHALQGLGFTVHWMPESDFSSEGLLALPALQRVHGLRILIIRGRGGLSTLGATLGERGAQVQYLELYERRTANVDVTSLTAHWPEQVQRVTVTSLEVLMNLIELLGPAHLHLLRSTPLITVSERVAQAARNQGISQVHVASGADHDSLLEALRSWHPSTGDEPCR